MSDIISIYSIFEFESEVNQLTDVRINLREMIRDRGFRQAAIARKAGMPPCKLSQVVNLDRKLEANEMFALCNAMGITPVELSEYNSRMAVK